MKWRLEQQEKKLDELFKLVEAISEEEVQAYLAKFLCIRTSGLLECAVKHLISEYTQGSSPQPIENYVIQNIRSLTNFKDEKLLWTLRSFSLEWEESLLLQITEEQRSALNSVISNRNNIAHGELDNISFASMKIYYLRVKEIIALLKGIIRKKNK